LPHVEVVILANRSQLAKDSFELVDLVQYVDVAGVDIKGKFLRFIDVGIETSAFLL
jgi:hypothetical protein